MNHKPIHEHKFKKGLLCALGNLFAWCLSIPSVPSVPQGITARSTDSSTVLVTWMEPAVSFREHTCNTTAVCLHVHTVRTCTVHVTSYLQKSADFRGNPSWISVKVCAEICRSSVGEPAESFFGICEIVFQVPAD